jgi:DNA-binding transcriptional regulator YdaS (Cro superfamily)
VASAELSVLIEKQSDKQITRQELRPDDYWLIWPDLPTPATAGV